MLRESNIELQNDIDIESRHWCTRKVFKRKNCAIFCGLLYYFLLGVEETVMSAYFSVVAKKRGLNSFQIGLAYTMMEVSNFGFSFVVMYAIKPKTEKLFFVACEHVFPSIIHYVKDLTDFLMYLNSEESQPHFSYLTWNCKTALTMVSIREIRSKYAVDGNCLRSTLIEKRSWPKHTPESFRVSSYKITLACGRSDWRVREGYFFCFFRNKVYASLMPCQWKTSWE